MTGTYHNVRLFGRLPTLRGRPAFFESGGAKIERVVSVSVETDLESGLILVQMSVDQIAEEPGPVVDVIAYYPLSQQREADEDAKKVAVELGYRYRRATPGVGWEWVDPTVVLAPEKQADLVIGG